MRIPTILMTISLIFLVTIQSYSQNKRLQRAYDTYNAGEYYQAIDIFKDAYQKITDKKEKVRITYFIADCYRRINDPKQAAMWYRKVISRNYEDPVAVLYYADMLKMLGEYEEAKLQYDNYKELVPNDARATDGVLSCDLALEWMEFPNGYVVEEMKFFNSKMSDYSPAYAREDYRLVYFTSTREETFGKKEHGGTGDNFADIFESSMDRKGKWSTPIPLSEEINSENEEGTPFITSDYSSMYFTRCEISKNKTMGCQIYVSKRRGESWEKPESVNLAEDSIVTAHPTLSSDELTMYFVSDMNGSIKNSYGKNSKDIWRVTRAGISDEWSSPVNIGEPINTPGDEVFPYMHPDGTLYFSSNGHIGMGGLDIFKAKSIAGGNWEIENMKYPVNSSSDDFGICFESSREAGFFSSARKGKSDDLYMFMLPPLKFTITGIVKNENTDDPIEGANIKSISSDGITLETETDTEGTFKFMLKPGTDYVFLAEKKGFLKGKERETTKNRESSTDFSTTIYLPPIDEVIRIDNIFFDFASDVLRPESTVSLDKLVETLNDNPNITIELGSHTDNRGNNDFNLDLSNRRAQSVVNYLISKGIRQDRLISKGYGETQPKVVDKRDHDAYPFIPEGQVLTEAYINSIEDEDLQELAHFLNRRTEFKVLTIDYNTE
ncbi:MAG: OmpA family protein [Bacteroidales bacterium]|nr:OmpA family protein [Bacteroidales bacterium]